MLYSLPKKVEMDLSQAKWRLESTESVLVVVGLQQLRQIAGFEGSEFSEHLISLSKKAKALDIPILDLNPEQLMNAMVSLGDYVSQRKQIIFAGQITPTIKSIIQHISSITQQTCMIDDAISLESKSQHLHWINSTVALGLHHMNTQTVLRLWALSAPTEFILSERGILLAVAEQLDMDALEIDPYYDLKLYGLDSVGIVSLVGLWRANGAHIRYEDFENSIHLVDLIHHIKNRV